MVLSRNVMARLFSRAGILALVGGGLLLIGLTGQALAASSKGLLQGSHGKPSQLPKSCRACHKGMTMTLSGEEAICLACHGSEQSRNEMIGRGYLKVAGGVSFANIDAELRKPYNHPTLTVQGVHNKFEALPEEVVNAARHAECVDCHNSHLTEKGNPFRGLKGRRVGNFIGEIEQEYQLCYRCHSESANLPGTSTDKHLEFKVSNPSYHPVEGEGKNTYVISLKEPYASKKERPGEISTITCGDCHGNDNPNGPRGPHGSAFRGLLKLNYQMEDGRPESAFAYELCYKCHDRTSILNNESFPYHALHIQGRLGGQDGASCFACHDAHGSSQYQHLIRFDEEAVKETTGRVAAVADATARVKASKETTLWETKSGKRKYDAEGYAARHGACYLNCHGVEHNPKTY